MPTVHIVQPGEHLSAIAVRHGFDSYRGLWYHGENAALRAQRKNPNVLLAGDRVAIPDRIFHPGISGSDAFAPKAGPGNRHTRGHCIDFSGAEVVEGTGPNVGKPFTMTVFFDWGRAPVPALDPKSPDKTRPVVKTPVAFAEGSFKWPSGDTLTLPYRLEHVRVLNDSPRNFFLDVYQFFNREYSDSDGCPGRSGRPRPTESRASSRA